MNEEKHNQEEHVVDAVDTEEMNVPEAFTQEEHLSHLGPILGVLIVVLVLILGGLYLWGATLSEGPAPAAEAPTEPRQIENNEPETPRAEADTHILETVSSSDEISAIETDIDNTNLDSLDAEIEAIDAELKAALGDLEAI
ncbi:MAG: hypothetical protein LR017_02640 [Candidatus Pacebacteria bacterium]|nr:hypothetical protein [Candidatus Paceibacterota bacterium]